MYHNLVSNVETSVDTHLINNFSRKSGPRYQLLPYFCVVKVDLQLMRETMLDACMRLPLLDWLQAASSLLYWGVLDLRQMQLSK